jgi:SAM-dependent methyltransferase
MRSEPETPPVTTDPEPAAAVPATSADPAEDEEHDWAAYYRYTLGREPRPLFTKGLDAMAARGLEPGLALDVGAGDGTETVRLLEAGWRVWAIDSAPASAEVLDPRVPEAARDRLEIHTAAADALDLPPFDLLYSAYVLSYLPPDAFHRLWAMARERLRPGGFLVVNIFGDRHEAAAEPDTTFLTRAEVEALLDGLEVLAFDEIEEDGGSFRGPTHWHLYDIVARRPR